MEDLLDRIASRIDKSYSIRRLSDNKIEKMSVIKSKCLGFDYALRCGGIPRGKIIEIFGNESGGKTTLSLMIADTFIKVGGTVLYIDAEHSIDRFYLQSLGMDLNRIGLVQPDTLEEGLDIVQQAIGSADPSDKFIVVIDSIAALVPKKELENGMDKETIGLQARCLSKFFRKIKGIVNTSQTTLVCINQTRTKIGMMWGNPIDTPGGKALKFYSSIRIEVNRKQTLKKGKKFVGIRSKIKVVKNKCGCPFFQTEVEIKGGKGVDYTLNTYETLKEYGVLNDMSIDDVELMLNKKKSKKLKRIRRKLMES